MEINGHDEVSGEEIDWACDTQKPENQNPKDKWIDDNDPNGEYQEEFKN